MKLYEKIRLTRKEKGIKLKTLYERIAELFGENALNYESLCRIEKGRTQARESSIFQIATALGLSTQELKQDTELAEPKIGEFIAKKKLIGKYVYNDKTYLEILSGRDLEFLPMKLVLLPGGKTQVEKDPPEKGRFIKWIFGLQGKVTLTVETKEGIQGHIIGKEDKIYFESINPHHFENNTQKKSSCIIVQNPRYI